MLEPRAMPTERLLIWIDRRMWPRPRMHAGVSASLQSRQKQAAERRDASRCQKLTPTEFGAISAHGWLLPFEEAAGAASCAR